MSKEVWKYELKEVSTQEILMPFGAEILTVQTQYDIPCIWAIADPKAYKVKRVINIFGTGHPIKILPSTIINHIGTYQKAGGSYIYHVFERIENE